MLCPRTSLPEINLEKSRFGILPKIDNSQSNKIMFKAPGGSQSTRVKPSSSFGRLSFIDKLKMTHQEASQANHSKPEAERASSIEYSPM